MKGILAALLIVIAIAGGGYALVQWRNQPPQVPFARVTQETIASSVPTNGKVEPIEWAEARSERAGAVQNIYIRRGDQVAKGAVLLELDSGEARAELTAAQARATQAHADIEILGGGGKASELASIDGDINREKVELAAAQKEYDTLRRLETKQAATPAEVTAAKDRVDRSLALIRALEQRRSSQVLPVDRSAAEARLRDAEAAVALAEERIQKSMIRAPVAGTLYQFDIKPGAYLNAGDLVGVIGQLSRVRVKVYVDEPDLGRVDVGKPVIITWDARPGLQWHGTVENKPTQVVALGTRQVGEVICVIENPGNQLLPGTNVNAEIRNQELANALTIPKEAVRRERNETGVYVLAADNKTVEWRKVELGIASTTRTQVQGLMAGDPIALPSERPLAHGMVVQAQFP